MHGLLHSNHGLWPAFPQTSKRRFVLAPADACAEPQRCAQAHAGKGFGAVLPKLPSFGNKAKVPAGGVAPCAPVDLRIPPGMERIWAEAQQQWRQYSIERPVLLPSLGAQVHIVPVGADLPGDAALIRDVVHIVQPDAIALESPPQHLKSYTSMARALEPQLSRLLAADLRTPSAARAALNREQREQLQAALLQACRGASVKPDTDQLTHLFRLGSVPFLEWLLPAHLVRTAVPQSVAAQGKGQGQGQQGMILVSCGLDRAARAAAPAASLYLGREFDVYLEEVEAALGEELYGEVVAWRTTLEDELEASGAGRELAVLLAAWEAQCCLGPEIQRQVAGRVVERMREETAGCSGTTATAEALAEDVTLEVVRSPAGPWVAKRLLELAAGKDVVRPCRCIVAVVGRLHALSLEGDLRRLAAGQ